MTNAARDFIEANLLPTAKDWNYTAIVRFIEAWRDKWDKPDHISESGKVEDKHKAGGITIVEKGDGIMPPVVKESFTTDPVREAIQAQNVLRNKIASRVVDEVMKLKRIDDDTANVICIVDAINTLIDWAQSVNKRIV